MLERLLKQTKQEATELAERAESPASRWLRVKGVCYCIMGGMMQEEKLVARAYFFVTQTVRQPRTKDPIIPSSNSNLRLNRVQPFKPPKPKV